eukprot:m.249110 g.249110  ORF g.249110 m.249110 type:complete len:158 (-) comp26680_c0_seq5:1448-1921(-)
MRAVFIAFLLVGLVYASPPLESSFQIENDAALLEAKHVGNPTSGIFVETAEGYTIIENSDGSTVVFYTRILVLLPLSFFLFCSFLFPVVWSCLIFNILSQPPSLLTSLDLCQEGQRNTCCHGFDCRRGCSSRGFAQAFATGQFSTTTRRRPQRFPIY